MKKISSLWLLSRLVFIMFFTSCNTTTKPELPPVLTTAEVTNITQTTAVSGGIITSDAGLSVMARGVCWSTKATPTVADNKTSDGVGIGLFTSSITGLSPGTSYFIRAYATTSAGTGYGSTFQITTIAAIPTITDVDGNVYHTITIGTQTWLVENLRTTKYNDGTSIPYITDDSAWNSYLTTPACCWYNNDANTNKNTYGALYNWYTINTAKLAPIGWHIPTHAEWTTLEIYVKANLGTSGSVAKALAANTYWDTSITTTMPVIGNDLTKNNSSGFSAFPGGFRSIYGIFTGLSAFGGWWSTTENSTTGAWSMGFHNYDSNVDIYESSKTAGLSVRCVRNSQ